jgi:hypothetical protein
MQDRKWRRGGLSYPDAAFSNYPLIEQEALVKVFISFAIDIWQTTLAYPSEDFLVGK